MLDRVFLRVRHLLERYLLLWLVLLSGLAYFWPRIPSTIAATDPFLITGPVLRYLFAATMLFIGSLLPKAEVELVFRRWPTVLGGTAVQFTVMPVLAYAMGHLWGLEGPWLIGLMMAGCVPGAMASNVLTMVARGNVSYSVSLTTSATLLSPIVVPLALWLGVGQIVEDFPVAKTCWELCWMVVIPVVTGHLLSRNNETWARWTERVGAILANLTILWIIAVVVAANRGNMEAWDSALLMALLGLNLGGYLFGYLGGGLMRLPSSMRRAITLEVGMQNAGLGATLATTLFPDDPQIALPAALYTFGCMFTGTILARLWAEFGGKTEPTDAA